MTSAEMAAPVMIALGVARRLAQVRTTTVMVSRMVGGRHLPQCVWLRVAAHASGARAAERTACACHGSNA